jgi:hypothetical protein
MRIGDGTGNGYETKVDSENRLHVDSVSRSQIQQAALKSNAFNINTGSITLTSANASGIFYIKNNEGSPLVLNEILVIIGATTGGSGDALIEIIKNPTTGTLISGATDVDSTCNRDFGSAKILTADQYKGAEGNTITDGEIYASTTRSSFGTLVEFNSSTIVLRKGNSLAVRYTPPASNTSQDVTVAVTSFLETAELN